MKHCLRESIPNLSNLVSMNLSYIATDQAVYLLSKHCPSLEDLCLDHSSVSDRCARFFCGYEKTSASQVWTRDTLYFILFHILFIILIAKYQKHKNNISFLNWCRLRMVVGWHKFIQNHFLGFINITVILHYYITGIVYAIQMIF